MAKTIIPNGESQSASPTAAIPPGAEPSNVCILVPGVKTDRSSCYCDSHTGSAQSLLAAGLVTPEQLLSQAGRAPGTARFNPDGTPHPTGKTGLWRTPGHKAVFDIGNGNFLVEIAVTKDIQRARRNAQQEKYAIENEKRIAAEVAAKTAEVKSADLEHEFGQWFEYWTGTKSQLQAAGIGVGIAFPGEPGANKKVQCKCPLGFAVEITTHHDEVKARLGLFRATSDYVKGRWFREPEQVVPYAPGVAQLIDGKHGYRLDTNFYVGTADALVACGLARLDQFPGQPGRGNIQCSYRANGVSGNNTKYEWALTIKRFGKDAFSVEVPASEAERTARKLAREQRDTQEEETLSRLKNERKQARGAVEQVEKGPAGYEDFRAIKSKDLETWLNILWRAVFCDPEGIFSFDVKKGSDAYDEIGEAFATLREVVQNGTVLRDSKAAAAMQRQKMVIAARSDTQLQSFISNAIKTPLRLVK